MKHSLFQTLSPGQKAQLEAFGEQLVRFNQQINLISPATETHVEERHLLHSLALAHRRFPQGSVVVDWGSGGGLPAIPLAIAFPDVQFVAVDSVGKKTQAIRAMARRLELNNLGVWQGRANGWPEQAHYAVSRATAPLADLWAWTKRAQMPWEEPLTSDHWAPGLVCLKGGELGREISAQQAVSPETTLQQIPLEPLLHRPYFENKYIVQVTSQKPLG